ncbi:14366_t:CDS:2 [Acaulospora morrowiae]|uniref:14366_t:CDS:1 n=1 Tax=Acaulospora morrowiae TaxID=94023 RepID=A0A9N8V6G2_9GLOM|nr:14366_t:CDS:2 [Acaulospora morrowiae]
MSIYLGWVILYIMPSPDFAINHEKLAFPHSPTQTSFFLSAYLVPSGFKKSFFEDYISWSLFVYNCVDSDYFVHVYYGNIITSALVASFSGALLIYRLRVYRDVKLFSDGLIAPLEGFLGFTLASAIMRIVCSIILLTDVFPSNYVFRAMLEDSQWLTSELSIATHLAGIFHAIPRVSFFQPTSTTSNLWIPSSRFIRIFYWFLLIFQVVFAQGSSLLYGFFHTRNKTLFNLFIAIRLLSYSITSLILALGYGIYGRLLVKLAKKSFELVRGKGGMIEEFGDTSMDSVSSDKDGRERLTKKRVYVLNREKSGYDIRLKNDMFKWYLRKMQIFNISATSTLTFWAIMASVVAFRQEEVWETLPMSKFHIFMGDIFTQCVYMVVLIGVLLSERRPNKDPSSFDTIISSQFTQSTSV